ncbi:MAG: adenylosuccinate synthase [Phycisphaeraceae bacterium]|nr:adenylosuccinate synthase [Phycisphaeraceae bacterium]
MGNRPTIQSTLPTGKQATSVSPLAGRCTAVVGLQWGDEGKGKVVDLLAPAFEAVVRYNGGANAGHSVVVKGERYALHLIPSGILYPGKLAVIGNGVVVDPEVLLKEADGLRSRGVDVSGLVISDRAHVVMPYHKAEDEVRERLISESGGVGAREGDGKGGIGTTKRGIGPCYADKAQRATAVRVGDLANVEALRTKLRRICAFKNATLGAVGCRAFDPEELTIWAAQMGERLRTSIRDTTMLLHDLLETGKPVLFEGANAALLDVDHGTYPFVTSSSTTVLGIPAGTGVPGSRIDRVYGVVKAYSTRVGNGPLPTEQINPIGNRIRERGREFGTTTGRPRRVGWLDLVAVRYSAMLNGVTDLAVMLLDVLAGFDELHVCTAYRHKGVLIERFVPDSEFLYEAQPVYTTMPGFSQEITAATSRADLPAAARAYLDLIEKVVGVPISIVSVGPDRAQTILA